MAIDFINGQASYSKDALLSTNYADNETVKGNHYEYTAVFTLPANSKKYFLTNLASVGKKSVYTGAVSIGSKSEDVYLKGYENTAFTGGTPIQFFNLNREKGEDYLSVITEDPNGTEGVQEGTLFRSHITYANSQGNVTFSGSGGASNIIIFNTDYNYLLELENKSSNDTIVELDYNFFELGDK